MSKIILKLDKNSAIFEKDPEYNELMIRSQMAYLKYMFEAKRVVLIKDICDIFCLDYNKVGIDSLVKYWYKQNSDDELDIGVLKLDDGSYEIVCKTDN